MMPFEVKQAIEGMISERVNAAVKELKTDVSERMKLLAQNQSQINIQFDTRTQSHSQKFTELEKDIQKIKESMFRLGIQIRKIINY